MPIKVAPKNVEKGIKKWPQEIPAISNNGLGILYKYKVTDAQIKTVKNAYFYKLLKINYLIFDINGF